MSGANIFIMYTSSDNQNVTVSPRLGTGNVEPQTSGSTAEITLLEGSGVNNGTMTANFRCGNCQTWSGGSMDLASSSGSWIYAARKGKAIDSDDVNAPLSQHDSDGTFKWNMTAAQGGGDVNPFLGAEAVISATASSSDAPDPPYITHLQMAHGIMASLAWVIFFPTGAIVLRLLPSRHAVWTHAGIQAFSYVVSIVSFGMGVYLATQLEELDTAHAIVGIVSFILASTQPLSGLLHHFKFVKTLHRNVWSAFHLTLGRAAIILGMINGGLGLQLAGNASTGQIAAYGVVAGVMGVVFIAVAVYSEARRLSGKRIQKVESNSSAEK